MISDVCGTLFLVLLLFEVFENEKTLRISLNLEKPPDFIKHISTLVILNE